MRAIILAAFFSSGLLTACENNLPSGVGNSEGSTSATDQHGYDKQQGLENSHQSGEEYSVGAAQTADRVETRTIQSEIAREIQENLISEGPACLTEESGQANLEQGQTALLRSVYQRATGVALSSTTARQHATEISLLVVFTSTRIGEGRRFCVTGRDE